MPPRDPPASAREPVVGMGEQDTSPDQIAVVRWLLENAAMKDASAYRAESLEGSRAVSACPCGCASVDFVPALPTAVSAEGAAVHGPRRAKDILAEAYTLWPDGARAGVMLWASGGTILGIELYDMGGDALRRFPTVEVLRRWEDYFGQEPG